MTTRQFSVIFTDEFSDRLLPVLEFSLDQLREMVSNGDVNEDEMDPDDLLLLIEMIKMNTEEPAMSSQDQCNCEQSVALKKELVEMRRLKIDTTRALFREEEKSEKLKRALIDVLREWRHPSTTVSEKRIHECCLLAGLNPNTLETAS